MNCSSSPKNTLPVGDSIDLHLMLPCSSKNNYNNSANMFFFLNVRIHKIKLQPCPSTGNKGTPLGHDGFNMFSELNLICIVQGSLEADKFIWNQLVTLQWIQ